MGGVSQKIDRIFTMDNFKTIKSYIAAQREDLQPLLVEIYNIVKTNAPNAKETIKYGIPTFVGNKNLVHLAIAGKHLGFYPTPSAIVHFEKELSKYKTSKGAIQFPLDKPLPRTLIIRIVKFRVKEDAKNK